MNDYGYIYLYTQSLCLKVSPTFKGCSIPEKTPTTGMILSAVSQLSWAVQLSSAEALVIVYQ